jgi:hypothetical protein
LQFIAAYVCFLSIFLLCTFYVTSIREHRDKDEAAIKKLSLRENKGCVAKIIVKVRHQVNNSLNARSNDTHKNKLGISREKDEVKANKDKRRLKGVFQPSFYKHAKKTVKPEVQADEQDAARETIIYSKKKKRGISKEDSNDVLNEENKKLKEMLQNVSHFVSYFL